MLILTFPTAETSAVAMLCYFGLSLFAGWLLTATKSKVINPGG
jgi:hypothetical protein